MLFTLSTISSKKLDVVFLHPKTGQAPFTRTFYSRKRIYSDFLLPQAKSRTFLGSKIVPFWCGKNNVKKVVEMSLHNKKASAWFLCMTETHTMTEKTITARSSFTMKYDPKFPNHLAAVHDDGHMNADGKLSHQPHKRGSIYFGEHDGESIGPAVELFGAMCGPLYIEGAKLCSHDEYTGTGDTSKSVWIESNKRQALKALDGLRLGFQLEQKLELIDGEWEPKSITYKVRTNIYKAQETFNY